VNIEKERSSFTFKRLSSCALSMTAKLSFLLVFSLGLVRNNAAQTLGTTDYFPLKVGNTWIYLSFEVPPYYYPDTLQIVRTEMMNDTLYYVQNRPDGNPHGLSKYLRKDSVGNVYGRISGRDQMIYDVSADVGSKWIVEIQASNSTISYTVTLEGKSEKLFSHAGVFENCLKFLVETYDITEATYYVWLAPGIGEVRRDGFGLGMNYVLKRGNINSTTVTSRLFHVFSTSPSASAENVDIGSKINFFLNTIPPQSIADSNISVFSLREGKLNGHLDKSSDGWFFVFTPEKKFPILDTITVILSARTTDWYGDSLDGNSNWKYEGPPVDDYEWKFCTGAVSDVQENSLHPTDFRAYQSYPNPFNGETNIEYSLPAKGDVCIDIYNVLGQEVETLLFQEQESGRHCVVWDAKDDTNAIVSSGVYFIQVTWNGRTQVIHSLYLR